MANRYVSHLGSNTSPYDTWAKAATTIASALSGSAAGDDFWVASDHSESTASALTLTFPGSSSSPNRCVSVSRAGSTPPVAADIASGAVIATSGANAIDLRGVSYFYGLTFNCGTGASAASLSVANSGISVQLFEACAFNLVNTGAAARIFPSAAGGRSAWSNCTVSFGATGQGFSAPTGGGWAWGNKPGSTAITGATLPTSLVASSSTSIGVDCLWSGLDLSALGSGKTLVAANSTRITISNCKLDNSATVAATPSSSNARGILVIGSSGAGNVRRDEIYDYAGTLTTETTIIRTAGASDGTTAYSWKIVTTANSKRTFPFATFEGALWNDTTGAAKTLTIHTVTDNVTLTDAEIWLEAEYLGSSGSPVATLVTDANATVLTTAANQASDAGEAWTTTGLTTPVKQKLEVAFTPEMIGPVRWKVKIAKASTTVYVDPNADFS